MSFNLAKKIAGLIFIVGAGYLAKDNVDIFIVPMMLLTGFNLIER